MDTVHLMLWSDPCLSVPLLIKRWNCSRRSGWQQVRGSHNFQKRGGAGNWGGGRSSFKGLKHNDHRPDDF